MGGMGGGMGGRGGGYGGGGMPDREEMERMRAAMEAVVRAPERLIIAKADPGLIVTDEEGVSTRLALDGSKETGAVNGVTFESATKWEDGKLRVERKFKGGLKLVETYGISGRSPTPDGVRPHRRRPDGRRRPHHESYIRAPRGGRRQVDGRPPSSRL